MATRLYGTNPGYSLESVTEAVGSATTAHNIELTVDLSSSIVTDSGATRKINKEEVLFALEQFKQYVLRSNWPPA